VEVGAGADGPASAPFSGAAAVAPPAGAAWPLTQLKQRYGVDSSNHRRHVLIRGVFNPRPHMLRTHCGTGIPAGGAARFHIMIKFRTREFPTPRRLARTHAMRERFSIIVVHAAGM
jgi:hypothetical protein